MVVGCFGRRKEHGNTMYERRSDRFCQDDNLPFVQTPAKRQMVYVTPQARNSRCQDPDAVS